MAAADTTSSNSNIQTREIQGRGRGFISTHSIKAGEILLTDSPILLYPAKPLKNNNNFCSNCFKNLNSSSSSSSVLTCPSCSYHALFCSHICQSKALSSSHSPWVCQALNSIRYTSVESSFDVSDAHFLVSAYNLAVISPPHFRILFSLDGGCISTINDSRILGLHSLISSLSPPQSVFGVSLELTAALLAKDKRNAFAIMEPFQENGERDVRAYGIYPKASFFNHDCLPNAARFDYVDACVAGDGRNTDMIVRAIHDFPEGREVCLSYFPVNWSYKDRQKRLLEDYGFVCDCDRCKVEVNWNDDDNNDDSMEQNEDEQMVGSSEDEDVEQEEADFPHAYFFLKYVCSGDNCGGTLAPLPPSEGQLSDVMECNVCGKLSTGEEIDENGDGDGAMVDE
ncbi:Histone-lysine n-methyltransferase ashr2 [Thalictrum thalictroides]|uniref:Histone-lysine n-methyltransferase ashr2 n=1 Tax=Thalictrum thalictroides TaxID=46969 RepID=A0A7J6WQH0_THATH|nr:Histone-lysine n-methyltransferase ashr2 [Thalictrum thalictroides]